MSNIDYILWIITIVTNTTLFQAVCNVSPELLEILISILGLTVDNSSPSSCTYT